MAAVYGLLQADGGLLVARAGAAGWTVSADLSGVEAQGRNLTVFLPGTEVLGLAVEVPARSDAEARRAVPFAIEDEIAQPVEAVHVALAPVARAAIGARRWVNVVAADTLQAILDELATRDLGEARLVSAHATLPAGDRLYQGPDMVLARLGDRSFSLDQSLGSDVIRGIVDRHPDATVHGAALAEQLGRPPAGDGAADAIELLVQLAQWQEADANGFNLRQGRFAPRRQARLGSVRAWRMAGALAAALAIAWFAVAMLETRALTQRTQTLQSLASEFAAAGWPESAGDVDRALAMVSDAGPVQGPAFPSALNASAAIYAAIESVEGSELRALRYDRARRQLTATLAFGAFADVDRLTSLISQAGLQARAGDARQSGDQVVGDIVVEAGQ